MERLRELLRDSTNFTEPWHFFHDELVTRQEFMLLGKPAKNKMLENILQAAITKVTAKQVTLVQPMFFHLTGHRFWHGAAGADGKTIIAFYFDDLNQGLAGFMEDPYGRRTSLVRISSFEIAGGTPVVQKGARGAS